MTNLALAGHALQSLWRLGVGEVIVCAGARNAPLVSLLSEETPFKVYSFFEERSAAFFALGRILSTNRPVAVVTTSGTAAAELLPAVIEADYQGLPLIAVTADRPRRYRGTGAPQAIEHVGLYSHYVEHTFDLENETWPEFIWSRRRPVHLNMCFDEPLLADSAPILSFADKEERRDADDLPERELNFLGQRPLVIVGGLASTARPSVVAQLRRWQRPVYLESPSGLRGIQELSEIEVRGGEDGLKQMDFDSVIRIGRIPTLRLWRDLETLAVPVVHFSDLRFSGLPRRREVYPLRQLEALTPKLTPWSAHERELDWQRMVRNSSLLNDLPLSEPAWVRRISETMPRSARVFLGNSLPIREWDAFAARGRAHEIFANRGVNGIDGLISTFLGVAEAGHSNWALLGDLSALYDLSGPWAERVRKINDINLVIINNSGGQIFRRMFRNALFENRHDLNFKGWADMWGWEYVRWDSADPLPPISIRPRVIEVLPQLAETEKFWDARK